MNRLVETGKNFMGYTSLHGLSRIADAKFWLKKLVWCLLFLGSLGMCVFQVTRLFEQFYKYQVNTKIEFQYDTLTFPGVAICNVNPIQYQHTVKIPRLFRIIRALSINTGIALEEFSLGEVYVNESLYVNNTYVNNDNSWDHAIQSFRTEMAGMPDDLLEGASQTSDQFINECRMNRKACNSSIIKPFRDPYYGLCFKLESEHLVFGPGEIYGLEVLLNVDQYNYLPFIAQSEGISLQIYNNKYSPTVATTGISLPVGFEVDIGITKKISHRLPGPYEICDVKNIFDSMQACLLPCINFKIIELCDCARDYIEEEEENDIHYCISDADVKCLLDTLANLETDLACPDCKPPCSQTTYEKSVSMKKWPSKNFEPYVKKFENHSLKSNDLIKLRVYYTSLLTESKTEEMAYTSENFVSDIGGQLGLWIGMSVVELVFLLIYACVRKTKTEDDQIFTANQKKEQNDTITVIEIE
ncbi:amiloride-sensitive sodium channel subunit gamma-like [Mizuhopecten yessoensis]|uniref:amiloride-sensitive sodium channel subunit gamma-like n=1 Tax=Mizuhopecten yessoensis TaxID=6573 RepID=UPI000B459DC3|nr:amiloride-sensitive sodium channel subunit gamma-like [Mizuhopecten yessoensis]